ncbi:ATV_HP_G0106030.mRNA.1.CDS.1 [Saccharomyces cerevisiae]|nr:ATV_HP_G0106030.mRNA.1.CDS.1 [Saccharomyces cerevisiae]CAI6641877.1 ATV_HP_G0106030.mRNA.1.CDS.1 [Saccharomyces cerevisiae]
MYYHVLLVHVTCKEYICLSCSPQNKSLLTNEPSFSFVDYCCIMYRAAQGALFSIASALLLRRFSSVYRNVKNSSACFLSLFLDFNGCCLQS